MKIVAGALVAVGVCALALAACGGPAPARVPASDGAIVYFDLKGKRMPFPMVRGTVAGQPTNMIVDTGAQVTVIAGWLAHRVSLATVETPAAQDPAGNPVPMMRADHVALTIDGVGALDDGPISVIDLPSGLEEADIGAIISPQAIAPVVVDLPRRRVSRTPIGAVRGEPLQHVRICRYESGGLGARSLVGEAVVDGVLTPMEIDTGADSIVVVADSPLGQKLALRKDARSGSATGAGGAFAVQGFMDTPVQIGSWTTRTTVTVSPGKTQAPCGYDGRLSINELDACVFVFGVANDVRVTCEHERAILDSPVH